MPIPLSSPDTSPSSCVFGVERSASGARWIWRSDDERAILTLSQKLGIPDMLARILVGRGILHETAADYLTPSLKNQMPDPCHLKDMEKAVTRLADAVERGETIGIFGDYDVDGATSTALLMRYFTGLGARAIYHIPDRQKEGYGPNGAALLGLQAQGASVVVTVDCGAVAFAPLADAKAAGIDVIVLDHHMGAAQLPEAWAVVNPNRLDETSCCRHLAAVGVTFLCLVALNRLLRARGHFDSRREPDLLAWLDLVALGTVCDVVPLTGLNRAFVRQGLAILAQRRSVGLNALLTVGRVHELPTTYHLGFILGPRINAGGRVGKAGLGVELLISDHPAEAAGLAAQLEELNTQRQSIEQGVMEQASAQAEAQAEQAVLMIAGEGWHQGVIGIVAGRLKERYHRPVAVLSIKDGIAKGSARSVPGVDFGGAVAAARSEGLLIAGGGHAMAAGFTVETARLEALHRHLETYLGKGGADYRASRAVKIDGCLNPAALTPEFSDLLIQAAPYGTANAAPRFVLSHCRVLAVDILKEKHVRLYVTSDTGRGPRLSALAFRAVGTALGDLLMTARGHTLHLAGQVKRDRWNGEDRVSFTIDDAHPA